MVRLCRLFADVAKRPTAVIAHDAPLRGLGFEQVVDLPDVRFNGARLRWPAAGVDLGDNFLGGGADLAASGQCVENTTFD